MRFTSYKCGDKGHISTIKKKGDSVDMKKFKKIIVGAMLVMALGVLVACGNNDNKDDKANDTTGTQDETANNKDNKKDDTAKDTGDAVEDVGEGMVDGVEDVGDGIKDAVDDAMDGDDNNKKNNKKGNAAPARIGMNTNDPTDPTRPA